MSNILAELVKSLGGGGLTSQSIGQFERDAIRGGRDVLGIESLPVDPNRVMSVPPEEPQVSEPLMSISPAVVEQAVQAIAATAPPAAEPAKKVFGGGGRSVPRIQPTSRGDAGGPSIALEQIPGGVDPSNDRSVLDAEKKRDGLGIKQRDLESRADAGESTESQIAKAVVALLPGLLGMGVGAATGGTYGALSGAAGGLTGAGAGLQRVDDVAREEKGKLVARAEKVADRVADIDKQIAVRKDRLEDRNLDAAERARQRNAIKELEMLREKFAMSESAEQRKFTAGEHAKQRGHESRLKAAELGVRDMDSYRDFISKMNAASAAASKGAGNKTASQLYTQMSTAHDMLNQLEGAVKTYGNYESSSSLSPFSDPKGASDLETAIQNFAVAYSKLVDPDSAVRESEVENAKKMIPMGITTDSKATQRSIQTMRNILKQKAEEFGGVFNQPIPEKVLQQAGPTAPGDLRSKYGF